MRDRCHRPRREEPSGPVDTEHIGVRLQLFLVKNSRDARRGVNQRRGIDACGSDTRGRQEQDERGIKPGPHDQATLAAGPALFSSRATVIRGASLCRPADRVQFRERRQWPVSSAFAPIPRLAISMEGEVDSGEPARAGEGALRDCPQFPIAVPSARSARQAQGRPCRIAAAALRVDDLLDHYRRIWDLSFNRLDECLHLLQAKARKHGRKQ